MAMKSVWKQTAIILAAVLLHGCQFSQAFLASNHWTSTSLQGCTLNSLSSDRTNSMRRTTVLRYASEGDPLARNKRRTDVGNFLTQRAIQSFIYLSISCRDPHTVRWLERTLHFQNLESFHGTGAFNMTLYPEWNSVLFEVMTKPKDVIIVQARRRGKGIGGWSKGNPYLEERFVEYEIDIDPPSLASRILSVREQLANEFKADLGTILVANDQILSSYNQRQCRARHDESITNEEESDDSMVNPELCFQFDGQAISTPDSSTSFDRTSMFFLSNAMAFDERTSSPLRKGNFDLLCLLATQEGIHRVLRDYGEAGPEREVSFTWLRDYYGERIAKYFDGHQKVGRADDFLDDLLTTAPSFKDLDDGRNVGLIDPIRIAEDIIRMRGLVVEEWQDALELVPHDHMELQKSLLAIRMGKVAAPPPITDGGNQTLGSSGAFE